MTLQASNYPTIRPTLDLQFAATRTLSPLITFTRSSSGTFFGSDGLLKTASADVPRFDHNPKTGESLGLLVEEQRTNLFLQSENLATPWNLSRSSFSSNVATAPDGTLTADKLVEDTTASNSHYFYQSASVTSGVTYTVSWFVKAAERTNVCIQFFGTNSAFALGTAYFSLSSGTVTDASTVNTASIVALGNGWYRISATKTATATATGNIALFLTLAGGVQAYTGDGTSGVFVWGAQLEAGAFPTSYIPTTSATATRSTDVASITGTAFSSWYRQDEGTIAYEGACGSFVSFPILVNLHDGTSNNYITPVMTPEGAGRISGGIGGVAWSNASTSNTVAINSNFRQASSYSNGAQSVCLNAAAIAAASNASMPSVDQIRIGDWRIGGQCINGTIRRIAYWPQRLSDSTLQRVTQ